jgi:hypothetical protein
LINDREHRRIERHCQHWAHKIQDEDKQSRDNVNIGHTSYRMKTNNRETLSTLGAQCLWIVYLHPVSCVPNVDSVSRLFIVIQYLAYPMLTVSLTGKMSNTTPPKDYYSIS